MRLRSWDLKQSLLTFGKLLGECISNPDCTMSEFTPEALGRNGAYRVRLRTYRIHRIYRQNRSDSPTSVDFSVSPVRLRSGEASTNENKFSSVSFFATFSSPR